MNNDTLLVTHKRTKTITDIYFSSGKKSENIIYENEVVNLFSPR